MPIDLLEKGWPNRPFYLGTGMEHELAVILLTYLAILVGLATVIFGGIYLAIEYFERAKEKK